MDAFLPARLPAPVAYATGPSLLDWILGSVKRTEREVSGVSWSAEPGTQNAAFLLRTQQPDLAERFGRNETVTLQMSFVKFVDRHPGEASRTVTFNTGADAEEFWKNYHSAVRGELESAIARSRSGEDRGEYEYEDDYDDRDTGDVGYESFGVYVSGLA